MIGYLLVRGGTHVVAYARALEHLTGADLSKLFPIPPLSNQQFPEARVWEDKGFGHIMFRFSPTDFAQLGEVWNGPHPETGQPLVVEDAIPEGAPPPDLPAEPQLAAPGVDMEMVSEVAEFISR
jgi:Mn-containing catalase